MHLGVVPDHLFKGVPWAVDETEFTSVRRLKGYLRFSESVHSVFTKFKTDRLSSMSY